MEDKTYGTKKITITINTVYSKREIKETVDELCAKGINNGCYQDINALLEVLSIITQAESEYADCPE